MQPDSPAVFSFAVFAQINIGFVSKASNSEVRANAAILFVEAFPIRDPALTSEDADIVIQKQFEEIFVSMDHAFNLWESLDGNQMEMDVTIPCQLFLLLSYFFGGSKKCFFTTHSRVK